MAGHSQFSNIKHRKGAQDKKRAKIFTRLTREIIIAAKDGLPDPNMNSRLRNAIIAAKAQNLPKDRIESAIKRGSSSGEGDNYEEMRYEGYAPGGIALIIEAQTDNKNRTAAEVRSALTKYGGSLAESGSVSYMFDHIGLLVYNNSINADIALEASIEAGAQDFIEDGDYYIIKTNIDDLYQVKDLLTDKLGEPEKNELSWWPQNYIEIVDEDKLAKLNKLLDALDDLDDVKEVYSNHMEA